MPLKGLIFDFDGTLAHLNIDFQAMRDDVCDLAREMGYDRPWPHEGYLLEQVKVVTARLGDDFNARAHDVIQAREVKAARESSLFSFTLELLAKAEESGFGIGVVSRNCRAAIMTAFPRINEYCRVFLPREEAPRPKPHPGQVLDACARLNLEPAEAAMIGDHPTDMTAGKAAGCLCIGVTTGRQSASELKEAGAVMVLDDASGLLEAIAGF